MTMQRENFFNHQKIHGIRVLPSKNKQRVIANCRKIRPLPLANASTPDQLQESMWLKAVRFVIVLSCVCLCLYQIGLRVKEYQESPIRFDLKIVRQTTFNFPSVTLCSGMLAHRIRHWVNVMECEKNNFSCSELEIENIGRLTETQDLNDSWIDYETKMEDLSIGKPCPIFVGKDIQCRPKPASQLMNTKILDTVWGRCLSLTLKNKKMAFKGPFTWILIDWQFRFNRTGGELLYFFVHQEGVELVHDAPFIADTVRVGYESKIRITAKEYYALNTRNNPCVSEETARKCFYDCVEKMMEAELTCKLPFINSSRLEDCDTIRKIVKAFRIADDFYGKLERNTCDCPRECNSTRYKMSVDGGIINKENQTKLILLFADDLKEQITEKKAFAQSALFSEIGGSLGLYLGVSIITLIHVVENIIYRLVQRVNKV